MNSKLHAVCDGQGRHLILLLTEGRTSDYKGAALMLGELAAAIPDEGGFYAWGINTGTGVPLFDILRQLPPLFCAARGRCSGGRRGPGRLGRRPDGGCSDFPGYGQGRVSRRRRQHLGQYRNAALGGGKVHTFCATKWVSG